MLILRLSAKRTLGQLNAFDVVVSVALGSLDVAGLSPRADPRSER